MDGKDIPGVSGAQAGNDRQRVLRGGDHQHLTIREEAEVPVIEHMGSVISYSSKSFYVQ